MTRRSYHLPRHRPSVASTRRARSIKLDGWSGRIITFKGTDNGRTLLMQHILLAKGHAGYFIDMDGDYDQAAADKALFKTIYKTWRAT